MATRAIPRSVVRARNGYRADPGLDGVRPQGEVSRTALVNRLRAARSQPVAVLVAPAGYGKTTVLRQWTARDGRAFAIVTVDRLGTEPASLVGLVAEALRGLGGGDVLVPGPSEPPARWLWRTAVPQLVTALRAIRQPFVLVFDDADGLEADSADVLTALIKHVPEGSTMALAGRSQPIASLPRLRASGEVLELGTDDLAFTRREARALLRSLGVAASEKQLDDVLERTEGWAVGIKLAGLAFRALRPASVESDDGDLSGFVQAECLAALTPEQRAFVRRTSILGRVCPALCDAVLERDDSLDVLTALERSHVFVIAVDRERQWFRYHRAVREQLRTELDELESEQVAGLERRAAAWLEANDEPEPALRHAFAAGDYDHATRLLEQLAPAMHNAGRDNVLMGLVTCLDETCRLADHPDVAVIAARLHAQRGSLAEAERCLAAAIGGPSTRKRVRPGRQLAARIDLVCAAMCTDGVESMLAATESALRVLPADDCWRPYGLLLNGCAQTLLGDDELADATLSRAVHAARRLGCRETCVLALTERALIASAEREGVRAGLLLDLAHEEIARGNLEGYQTSALTLALSARLELLHGHSPEAFAAVASARALLSGLGHSLPWLAVQARLELAEAEVALRNEAAARSLLGEIDALLAGCPRLGTLRRRRSQLATEIRSMPVGVQGRRSLGLTAAELRLVPMLATHLSFREIGASFFLSRNTVKTQAISVYRKLGASSRSEAVARAYGLGLIEPGTADADVLIQTG